MRVRHFGVAVAALAVATMGVSGCGAKKAALGRRQGQERQEAHHRREVRPAGHRAEEAGRHRRGLRRRRRQVHRQASSACRRRTSPGRRRSPRTASRSCRTAAIDLVIASYSITTARLPQVTFGGPYFVAHQDIMVRGDDTSIKTLADLKGKSVCQVSGSNSWKNLTDGHQQAQPEGRASSSCRPTRTKSASPSSRAARSTRSPPTAPSSPASPPVRAASVKVDNVPFTDEKYGVGMQEGRHQGLRGRQQGHRRHVRRRHRQAAHRQVVHAGQPARSTPRKPPAFQGCS